jgi:hypothetical protein
MGDRQLDVTGTCQNRLISVPLQFKQEAERTMKKGNSQADVTQDDTIMLWKDNKPVYMANNFEEAEPMGSCET